MKAGIRDVEVTIQYPVTTRDPEFNEATETWHTLATVWADVLDMLPSHGERLAVGVNIANQPARVRMLFRDDVTPAMRLKFRGKYWRIVGGPSEFGFREGIEMLVETSTLETSDLQEEYPGS